MTNQSPTGYRPLQIALHWLVAAIVLFLFITGDNTTHVFFAGLNGRTSDASWAWIPIHIVAGLAILGAMIWRLALRRRFGAPEAPASEPAPLRLLAGAVHVGLYLDMIGAAIVGLLVYFWYPSLAGLHELLGRFVLIVLVALHVAGALWHHFYWRSDVLTRMLRPQRG